MENKPYEPMIDGIEFKIDPAHFLPPNGFHGRLLDEYDRQDPADGSDTRHLYSVFGLATYLAQCIELTVGNIAVLHEGLSGKIFYRHEADAFDAAFNKKTLGMMLRDLRSRISWDDQTQAIIDDVLARRNALAHRFFIERATEFATHLGRRRMIKYLIDCADRFYALDELMSFLTRQLGKIRGAKVEHFDQVHAELEEQARKIEAAEAEAKRSHR